MNNACQDKQPPKCIGLFGGTFNPIHNGHVQAALDVMRRFALDRIHFIPSAQPPHKTARMLAPAQDRYQMTCLGLQSHGALQPCDIEIRRSGPSYTVDTLRAFKRMQPPDGAMFFLVGVDAFLEIDTWKSYDQLMEDAAFIVMTRPGRAESREALQRLVVDYVHRRISSSYRLAQDPTRDQEPVLHHPDKRPIHLTRVTPVDISSSRLRAMIAAGEPVDAWIDPRVAAYIKDKGLYQ